MNNDDAENDRLNTPIFGKQLNLVVECVLDNSPHHNNDFPDDNSIADIPVIELPIEPSADTVDYESDDSDLQFDFSNNLRSKNRKKNFDSDSGHSTEEEEEAGDHRPFSVVSTTQKRSPLGRPLKQEPRKCGECGKEYRNPYELNIHRNAQHENVRFSCTICGGIFKHQNSMIAHKKKKKCSKNKKLEI